MTAGKAAVSVHLCLRETDKYWITFFSRALKPHSLTTLTRISIPVQFSWVSPCHCTVFLRIGLRMKTDLCQTCTSPEGFLVCCKMVKKGSEPQLLFCYSKNRKIPFATTEHKSSLVSSHWLGWVCFLCNLPLTNRGFQLRSFQLSSS